MNPICIGGRSVSTLFLLSSRVERDVHPVTSSGTAWLCVPTLSSKEISLQFFFYVKALLGLWLSYQNLSHWLVDVISHTFLEQWFQVPPGIWATLAIILATSLGCSQKSSCEWHLCCSFMVHIFYILEILQDWCNLFNTSEHSPLQLIASMFPSLASSRCDLVPPTEDLRRDTKKSCKGRGNKEKDVDCLLTSVLAAG